MKERRISGELHSSVRHVEGAAPWSLGPTGGAVDSEDLSPLLLLAASCCGGHVIRSLLSCAQQPVGHQSLSVGVRGGSTVAPPDGVCQVAKTVILQSLRGRTTDGTDFRSVWFFKNE